MDNIITQVYTLVRIILLAVISLLLLINLLLERRPRRLSPGLSIIRAFIALTGILVLLVISGVSVHSLWAAAAAVIGGILGYLSGIASEVSPGGRESLTIKRKLWPMLVMAAGYFFVAFNLLYGTTGLFSIALLLVILGVAMVTGSAAAEIRAASRGASS